MNWTYTGNPASSNRDAVRFLIGDTDPANKRVSDEEVTWALSEEPNVYLAAAVVASSIAALFADRVSKAVGDLRIEYGQQQKNYADLAVRLTVRGNQRAAGFFAGGISHDDKQTTRRDTDLVNPSFRSGMHDNPAPDDDADNYNISSDV